MTKPRKRATSTVQVNATVKEALPHRVDWFDRVKSISFLALAITSLGTIWIFGQGLFASGPLPVPSRAEVQAVAATVKEIHDSEEVTHKEIAAQLKGTSDLIQATIADTRTSRLRSLRPLLEQAKANHAKEPTEANRDILDALQNQWNAIQDEIMKAANK